MDNTKKLYKALKRFQDERTKLTAAHDATVQYLERFKGSEGYDVEMREEENKFAEKLKALRDQVRPEVTEVMSSMVDAVGRRSVPAPTAEEINLLNLLKMKNKPSLEEIERVAQAVRNNPVCLSIVSEVAKENGYPRSFEHLCPEMSNRTALEIIQGMRDSLEDYLQHDTTPASRRVAQYHSEHYGNAVSKLTPRPLFDDYLNFYEVMYNMGTDALQKFSDIVDD